jgi:hypothetical protein
MFGSFELLPINKDTVSTTGSGQSIWSSVHKLLQTLELGVG